jgi:hypothetical protein
VDNLRGFKENVIMGHLIPAGTGFHDVPQHQAGAAGRTVDTVLNLGLNDKSVHGFIKQTGNERAGWDCYRRFIDMFGDVVMGPSPAWTTTTSKSNWSA